MIEKRGQNYLSAQENSSDPFCRSPRRSWAATLVTVFAILSTLAVIGIFSGICAAWVAILGVLFVLVTMTHYVVWGRWLQARTAGENEPETSDP